MAAAELYESMSDEFLLEMRLAFELDLRDAVRPESIAFCVGRIALIAAIIAKRRRTRYDASMTPAANAWDRETVRHWLEEASGEVFPREDSSADSLIHVAQSLGLTPADLHGWIYLTTDWSPRVLVAWFAVGRDDTVETVAEKCRVAREVFERFRDL